MIQSTLTEQTAGFIHTLPCEFNYELYIPNKRITVTETGKAVFTQRSVPRIVHGNQSFKFSIQLTTKTVAQQFKTLYELDDLFYFKGADNEEYLVEFATFSAKRVSGYFELKGTFRVLCVIAEPQYDWNC